MKKEENEAPEKAGKDNKKLLFLALTALGVVYGDIGTSPLYAIRECFRGPHRIEITPENIFGILSLVFWALIIVISIKYLLIILRADNDGEGGILALMEVVRPNRKGFKYFIISGLGLFGSALLYGDSMITPAISVLSAVEGLEIATPYFNPFIIPITIIILLGLFVFQRRGTAKVGAVFGPITLVWFIIIAALGVSGIIKQPEILRAASPIYAIRFFADHGWHGMIVLGVVFLVVTGGEALYADLGHFGKSPIRLTWYTVVLPCLLLNYFGQGALLLKNPTAAANPFYLLAPHWALYPLVIMATLATIIASQAVISGAFSLTFQALQLGYLPRFIIRHTSKEERGQIYLPQINNILMIATILLVLGFRTSSNLASAYGLAVTMTMTITSLLAFIAMYRIWKWGLFLSSLTTLFFLVIDLSFLSSNILKIPNGGWLPLLVGIVVLLMMTTWQKGRSVLAAQLEKLTEPLDEIIKDFKSKKYPKIPGTAVYLTSNPDRTPPSLTQNVKHNKSFHKQIIMLSLRLEKKPHVYHNNRLEIEEVTKGFYKIIAHYGFMDNINVRSLMRMINNRGVEFDPEDTTYVLGRETLIPTNEVGMRVWRDKLFLFMSRNSQRATEHYNIPHQRVFEIGIQIKF